jgi:hypothetical protein
MIGAANACLGRVSGLWQLLLGTALGVLMFWVIDPKLKAVSVEYELQQAKYLERLERRMRWREQGGDAGGEEG